MLLRLIFTIPPNKWYGQDNAEKMQIIVSKEIISQGNNH